MHAHLVDFIHKPGPHATSRLLLRLLQAHPASCSRAGWNCLVCKQCPRLAIISHHLSGGGKVGTELCASIALVGSALREPTTDNACPALSTAQPALFTPGTILPNDLYSCALKPSPSRTCS